MKNQDVVIIDITREEQAENFARGGVKAMGVCIALTSNEHPLIRLSGLTLAVFPKSSKALIPLAISLGGFILAKNKKKALIQRAFCFGSTTLIAGIISFDSVKNNEEITK